MQSLLLWTQRTNVEPSFPQTSRCPTSSLGSVPSTQFGTSLSPSESVFRPSTAVKMYPTLSISLVPFALSLLANAGFSPHLEACFTNRTLSPPNEGAKPPNPGSGITGDRLNVTRCYCEAPTFDNWGFFLQADYSNYHNGRSYTTQYACVDDTRSQPDIPKCWDAEDRFGRSTCVQDDQENQFCYETHYEKFHKKHK